MDLFLLEETAVAIVKAGVKEDELGKEEIYGNVTVESDRLSPAALKIIREVCEKPKFKEHIENRRVLRKLEAIEALAEVGPDKVVVKTLPALRDAMVKYIAKLPGKLVFKNHETYGVLLPYFVSSVKHHPATKYSPERVSLNTRAVSRGQDADCSTSFDRKDIKGGKKVSEVLAAAEIYPETPDLVAQFEFDVAAYKQYAPQTGEQFLGVGNATIKFKVKSNEDYESKNWRKGTASLEKDGVAARLVMDDKEDRGDKNNSYSTAFWTTGEDDDDDDNRSYRARRDTEVDEESVETYLIPIHPILRVFNLGTHEFFECHVSEVTPYKYDAALIEKLILPQEQKDLIGALTGSVVKKMSDIIKGKATGVIVLCSGKPGTGKTLTAEVYSEEAQRPLYTIQCSQLGTDAEKLEVNLAEVLERATRWRAILLIDEADVYIHERGADIQQNAIVGVFLRLLEYYQGILFLTTNRETVVDDAIVSRVTAHVRYSVPDETLSLRLWEVLSKQYGVELNAKTATKEFSGISGRSIRQLIRLASFTAGKKLTIEDLKRAAKYHDFTEKDKEA